MDLIKKNIHMNRDKCKSSMSLTLDNDINVPDKKPDISYIIREQGEIKMEEAKVSGGKALLSGSLYVNILYVTNDFGEKLEHMSGKIDFNEVVSMPDVCDGDNVYVKTELEDITTRLINSRKISVNAILKMNVSADELFDEQAAVAVVSENLVVTRETTNTITELALCKKDTFRIKEEVSVAGGRDSIREILYQDVFLYETELRMLDNRLSLKGEMGIYILYYGAEGDRINSYETTVNFDGVTDCNGCDETMIPEVHIAINTKDIQVKADEDGEDRVLDIEVVLGLDMKVYREEEITFIADMYCLDGKLTPIYSETMFDNLVVRNNSKARISDVIKIEENKAPILQMSGITATPKIDMQTIKDDGIELEGVIEVDMLYFAEDDKGIIAGYKGMIPFTHFVEARGIEKDCVFDIVPQVSQINETVINQKEVDFKIGVSFDTVVFNKVKCNIITDYKIEDFDWEDRKASIIGYIVKDGDTLWDVAKKFYVTKEKIMEINELESENIKQGDKLLICK